MEKHAKKISKRKNKSDSSIIMKFKSQNNENIGTNNTANHIKILKADIANGFKLKSIIPNAIDDKKQKTKNSSINPNNNKVQQYNNPNKAQHIQKEDKSTNTSTTHFYGLCIKNFLEKQSYQSEISSVSASTPLHASRINSGCSKPQEKKFIRSYNENDIDGECEMSKWILQRGRMLVDKIKLSKIGPLPCFYDEYMPSTYGCGWIYCTKPKKIPISKFDIPQYDPYILYKEGDLT